MRLTKFVKKQVSKLLCGALLLSSVATVGEIQVAQAISKNDIEATGKKLTLNESATGVLEEYDGQNWYIFDITERGYFSVDLQINSAADTALIKSGWKYSVYHAEDWVNPISTVSRITTNEVGQGSELPLSAGRYYISVDPADSRDNYKPIDCYYDIKVNFTETKEWELEDNDSNAEANIIEANKTYYGNFHDYEDVDWYKVTTPGNGTMQLDFGPNDSTDSTKIKSGWSISILNVNAEVITEYTTTTKLMPQLLPFKQGTFYIKVAPADSRDNYKPINCIYDLKIKFTETQNWELENNDSNTEAHVIEVNEAYYGDFHNYEDVDWYKVTTPGNGTIQLDFGTDTSTDSAEIKNGWSISILNTDAQLIKEYTTSTNLMPQLLPFEQGTFYIKVAPADSRDNYKPINCIYNLKVNFNETQDWEKEYNNESTNATQITSGKEYHGILSWEDDVDWYRIDNEGDVDVTLQLRVDESASIDDIDNGWHIEIYNSTEESVLDDETANNLNRITRTTTQAGIRLAKGTTYIRVLSTDSRDSYQPTDCLYHLTVTTTPVKTPDASPEPTDTTEPTETPDVSPSTKPTGTPAPSTQPTATPTNTSKPSNTTKPNNTSGSNNTNTGNQTTKVTNEEMQKVIVTSTVTTSTVISKNKRSVYLRWKKQKYAGGYEIYRSTKKKKGFKKVKTITKGSKVSWTDTKVKGGKTYYYKIRAFRKIGGRKSVSGFSKVKQVKVKK